MDVYEVRHRNLLSLLDDYQKARGGSAHGLLKDFGKLVGISGMQMSHLRSGPDRRKISSAAARKIEGALNLPGGWMDSSHSGVGVTGDGDEDRFLRAALTLFRASPLKAQEVVLQALAERLDPCTQESTARSPSTSRKP